MEESNNQHGPKEESDATAAMNVIIARAEVGQAYGTIPDWLPYCQAGVVTKHPSGFQSCPSCGVLGSNCRWDNVIAIPIQAPDKPSQEGFFPIAHTSAALHATGINIPRSTNDEHTCGVCKLPCNNFAGSQWYQLTKWDSCHQKCWVGTCACYHESLNGPSGPRPSTLGSFITFLEE